MPHSWLVCDSRPGPVLCGPHWALKPRALIAVTQRVAVCAKAVCVGPAEVAFSIGSGQLEKEMEKYSLLWLYRSLQLGILSWAQVAPP